MADTHGCLLNDVPESRILVHAGDACDEGTQAEFERFCDWFNGLPHPNKVFVPGNHDRFVECNLAAAREMMPGTTILIGESVEIDGIRLWGGPWTPGDGSMSFSTLSALEARARWLLITSMTDVLVTHGPPKGMFDGFWHGWRHQRAGCPELRAATLRNPPRVHIFGHIHEQGGRQRQSGTTRSVNAAVVDAHYRFARDATVVELTK